MYHLPVDGHRRVRRDIFDVELPARLHDDPLRRGVVREVEPREEVVHGVVVEPQVDPRLVERELHAPVRARDELLLAPVPRLVARVDILGVLGVVVHESHREVPQAEDARPRVLEQAAVEQAPLRDQ